LLPDNLRTGVQDAHAEHSRDSATRVSKTRHLSAKTTPVMS